MPVNFVLCVFEQLSVDFENFGKASSLPVACWQDRIHSICPDAGFSLGELTQRYDSRGDEADVWNQMCGIICASSRRRG